MASEAAVKIAQEFAKRDGITGAWECLAMEIDFAIAAAVQREREACAELCDQHDNWRWLRETYQNLIEGSGCEAAFGAGLCAAAIRNRKEQPDEA